MQKKSYKVLSLVFLVASMMAITACNDSQDQQSTVVSPTPTDTRDQRFLTAKTNDVIQVTIADLIPTQGAIGYDQIYYKLGRWQGDLQRPTWQADPANQLVYLNKTIGKKFSDYCEAIGAKGRDDFTSLQDLQKANLKQLETFNCQEQPGTETADLKTVVVGYDGRLYLTDGHHTMTEFRELPDGGGQLKVWVKVVGNYSDSKTADEFWAKMLANGQAWLRDGKNQPISYQQLPKNLGLKSATNPDGMQNNPYRSLVYFTRDIGYSKVANATDYTEFLWEDWFNKQIANNLVHPLSFYHTDASVYGAADVLATTEIKSDLTVSGSATGYQAAVADYSLLMGSTKPTDIIYGTSTAADLGALQLMKNAAKGSVTATSISNLADLTRDEIKKDKTPRTGGSIWYAVNYKLCGKPATGTCWGW
ncbi:ParB/Srx family N-terminal domain-containing protein [Acinetobacter nosocomialis]|uniref:ParB/Srx family N-terminal domain-containing protein n=1 Tax=Acinetobacter nosocomialis TaxID=106654 RepID=UPI002360133E|nr:ParB/Srx family N-terminal domain-containing protein [Acinetobacter nosocomialis]MDC9816246.1 ParB/Srx family N-terminal domain-containing protein [Acinetobacter nosocomialis]MDE9405205.1 ParB/Srx family N-terminal domain-containing protein [Acinetobacter nosocomialis]HDG9761684.1 ParB/Srx family N-terminal domain-containing protein [Acinetobacter nosocomialis]